MAENGESLIHSALEDVDAGLMGIEKELKGINEHLEEHTKTDEHYRSILEKMYAAHKNNNKEENDMHVEVPTLVAGGSDNSAALVAAIAAGNRGNYDGGFGGGGLLTAALLSGGLFGNRDRGDWNRGGEGCVTPSQLTAGLTGVTDAIQNTTIADSIGDVKQGIYQAEGNLQLAIAVAQSELAGQINSASIANMAGQAGINQNINNAIASSLASQNSININVLQTAAAGISATKDAQYALAAAIKDDGEKTRALITSNTITELQRQLGVSQLAGLEDRLGFRSRETEINITNTNTATAQQAQGQLQAQQQAQLQIQTIALLQNLIGDTQAIRQGSVVFNSGTMAASGNQTAANTKVA